MNRRPVLFHIVVVCCLLAVSLASPVGVVGSSSPDGAPVITFEESILGPHVVRNQYCLDPSTNTGVEFLDKGGHIFEPAVSTASPTHAMTNVFPGEEFQMKRRTRISFTAAQSDVSVKVGLDRVYTFDVKARLTAYSTAVPTQVSLLTYQDADLGQGPAPVTTLLSVSRTQGDIRSIIVEFFGPGIGKYAYEVIDDLTYSVIGPTCVTDLTFPTVQITKPAVDDQSFSTPTTEIAFTATDAESGIAQVRVRYLDASDQEIDGFSYCGGANSLPCGSSYGPVSGDVVADLPEATRTIRVEADDFAGHPGHADRTVDLLLPSPDRNLWLQGVEVTQATQNWVPEQTQTRSSADPPQLWIYPGPPSSVPLVAGRKTVVRVYAGVEDTGLDVPLVGATARLGCYTSQDYNTPCPGPPYLTSSQAVTVWPAMDLDSKRGEASLSWNFVLPEMWTQQLVADPGELSYRIFLEAEVEAPPALPECAGCRDTANRMRVAKVDFYGTWRFLDLVDVFGYNWTVQGQTFMLDPDDVKTNLDFIRKLYPIKEATVPSSVWVGTYDDGLDLAPSDPGGSERCDKMLDFAKGGYASLGIGKRLTLIVREFPCGGVGSRSKGHAFAGVGAEENAAHELGHARGLKHSGPPPGHNAECPPCDSDWPWPHGTLGHHGFDTVTMEAIIPGVLETDPHDFMSYGDEPYWISPRNWTKMFNYFAQADVPIPGTSVEQAVAPGDYLWARGRLEDASSILQPAYEMVLPAGSNDDVGEGEYRIELLDAGGGVLSERRFTPEAEHIDGVEKGTAIDGAPSFNEVLPLPAGVVTMTLRHGTDTLASRPRSAQVPSVAVLSPTAAGFEGQPANPYVAWSGGDGDGQTVFHLVQYTRGPQGGGEAVWETLGIDVTGDELPVSLEGLGGSSQAMVRVLATDGFNTTTASSPTFTVADKPPAVQIISPLASALLEEGETAVLLGTGSDLEDGLLGDEALSWYDGFSMLLGTGRRLDVPTLSPGAHRIILRAEDSAGQMDMDIVPITVTERPNTQPVADAGPDRTTGVGSPVTLYGAWSSDADGDALTYHWEVTSQPGGSQPVLSDLSAILPTFSADQTGSYTVTLVVNDGQVSSLPDRVSVIVGAAGARIFVSPPESSVTVTDTVVLDLAVEAIEDLYAAQVELSFDPSVVEVVDAYDFVPGAQIEEGDFPVPDAVITNSADNATGQILYTVSLQGPKPGVNGSGTLARITFRGLEAGLGRIGLEEVILSDPGSIPLEVRAEDGVVVVDPAMASAVAGNVTLERRSSNAGVEARMGGRSATTEEAGEYVVYGVAAGSQTITLTRESYLATWGPATVVAGQTLTLPDATLLGGDVDGDDRIGQLDAAGLAVSWNAVPADARWNGVADITDDGAVNVLDMVAVAYNFGEMAPGPWAGTGAEEATVGASHGVMAPEATTKVVISPTLAALPAVGETVEVQIRVEDVERLYGGHVMVEFDPTVLRVRDADPRPSAPGKQVRPGEFLDVVNRYQLVNEADNGAGTVEYAVTQLYPATARDGSGELATIIFEGAGAGSSPVHISVVELADDTWPFPQPIPASTQDGQVTVADKWPTYLPLVLRGS